MYTAVQVPTTGLTDGLGRRYTLGRGMMNMLLATDQYISRPDHKGLINFGVRIPAVGLTEFLTTKRHWYKFT